MKKKPQDMNSIELLDFLMESNRQYREGNPHIDDLEYDIYRAEFARREPSHPYLNSVEPEKVKFGHAVTHEKPMLSTAKGYTPKDLKSYVDAVVKVAKSMGDDVIDSLRFEVTPKLDGQAAFDNGKTLVTRGNGLRGNDITDIFDKGVLIYGNKPGERSTLASLGAGEVVIENTYFEEEIKDQFGMTHPRNFISGMTDSDEVKPHHAKAIDDGRVFFYPFSRLPKVELTADDLLNSKGLISKLIENAKTKTPFAIDGVVLAVNDQRVRDEMGATNSFNKWAFALKEEGEFVDVKIREVIHQVGRTGQITPVAIFDPVIVSRASISQATCHNDAWVRENQIGVGAIVRLVRAGEVIPKISSVVDPVAPENVAVATVCPSCGTPSVSVDRNAVCINPDCRGQKEATTLHFFSTLGNVDEFGPATISRLYDGGFRDVDQITALTLRDAISCGFGQRESERLIEQLNRGRTEPVEDWRFLAAFGISHLGRGDSRKILAHYNIDQLGEITTDKLRAIEGFGQITAPSIASDIKKSLPLINLIIDRGVNLVPTRRQGMENTVGANRKITFTGTLSIPRKEAQEKAVAAGFMLADTVAKGGILVTGEKVGATKTSAAEKKGAEVITEAQFFSMIESRPQDQSDKLTGDVSANHSSVVMDDDPLTVVMPDTSEDTDAVVDAKLSPKTFFNF